MEGKVEYSKPTIEETFFLTEETMDGGVLLSYGNENFDDLFNDGNEAI
jgi:hypothetical protein